MQEVADGGVERRERQAEAGSEYMDLRGVVYDGRHASLQLTPDKMMSWDFRKTGRP